MISTQPQPLRAAGRRSMIALSVLALLALACLPGLAQAESSAGLQYTDAPPTATDHNIPTHAKSQANSSKTNGGDSDADKGGAAGSSDKGSGGGSSSKPGDASKGDGGNGQEQGSRGKDSGGSSQKDSTAGTPVSSTEEDDGGSSPLVAILIAIAVLAAISIGVLVMRQRRGGSDRPGDAPASPKASS